MPYPLGHGALLCSLRRQTRVCCSANGSRRWTASVVMPAAKRKAAPSKSLLWPVLAPRALPHASYVLAAGPKLQHRSVTSAWPVGLMDKASASGAGDSRLESWAGQALPGVSSRSSGSQRLQAQVLKWNCPGRSWCKARARQGLQPRSQVAPAAHARAVECWHWRSARRPRVDSSGVAARL